jgi:hypothetical protein
MPHNAAHRRQVLRRELIENGIALFVIAIFFGLAVGVALFFHYI